MSKKFYLPILYLKKVVSDDKNPTDYKINPSTCLKYCLISSSVTWGARPPVPDGNEKLVGVPYINI